MKTRLSRSWLCSARLICGTSALLLLPLAGWGRGAVLWDQGVSLRFNEAGFLDSKDAGSFVPLKGKEWLLPLPNYLSGLHIQGHAPLGKGVTVNRSTQTAEGRFSAKGAEGHIKWTLGTERIHCAITLDWFGMMAVEPLGDKARWKSLHTKQDGRQWSLAFSVDRPDRSPKQAADRIDQNSEMEALATDPSMLIQLDGPLLDQIAVSSLSQIVGRSFQGSAPGAPPLCGPFSTTRRKYEGRVFWDADVWMLPSLMVLNRQAAQRIAQFRLGQQSSAAAIAWSYAQAGYPRLEPRARKRTRFVAPAIQPVMVDSDTIRFPWESNRWGGEAGQTESMLQEHINGSVCLGLQMAADWGIIPSSQFEYTKKQAGNWYLARSSNQPDGLYRLEGTLSPDESSIVSNDLYTNSLAEWLTGKPFYLPKDDGGFLTFDGDLLRGYKQHAALLTLFPLQSKKAELQARSMLERFTGKASKDGPAMSLSLEALLWARQGEPVKAYQLWQESWSRYCQTGVFTERPKGGEDVFVTGAAGSLNAVIYGFAGMRMGASRPESAKWAKKLASGRWLSFEPHLPKTWTKLTFTNLVVEGAPYRIEVSSEGVLARPRKVFRSPQPQ